MALQLLARARALYSGTLATRFFAAASSPTGWIKTLSLHQPASAAQGSARCLHNVLDVQTEFSHYQHERRTFKLTVPQKFNFARDIFDVWAAAELTGERSTSNPALWWVDDKGHDKTFSFQTLAHLSRKVSNVLTGPCQLSKGDCVIIILPRIPEWWMLTLGCIRAGIVNSPGTTLLRAGDIKHRLQTSKAKSIISDSSTVQAVEKVCDECPDLKYKIFVGPSKETRPGWLNFNDLMDKSTGSFQTADTLATDTMSLFFTSGTTGKPKMTEHSQSSYGLGHLVTARYLLMASPKDVVWNMSDTGWAKCAWSCFFAPWLHGACVFIQHSPKFDPDETLRTLRKFPVNVFCMPPTAARVLVKHGLINFTSKCLRHTVCGGEPVNPELIEEWHRGTGLQIYEAYGQTETTLLCYRYPFLEYRPGSMGKAAPGVDLQVVDEEGNILERGLDGIIGVRCRPKRPVGLFTCYRGDPEKTQSVFKGDFYLTGDRGVMDDDGYFYFVGRDDDVITSSGYRIGPFEVESALIEHPAVLESAVVSSPDETRGEVVKAFVTLTQQAFETSDLEKLKVELQEHVKNVTAPYKYPRKIEFVGDLPKTISGKIRRVELRQQEWLKNKEK